VSAQRIKGQEVSVLIIRAGALEDTLTDIQSFNMEVQLRVLSQGYLGEKNNRKDDIYDGFKFDMELNIHTEDYFNFLGAILDRARRNTPDVQFNITGVFSFPNGQTPTLLLPDVHFGAQPIQIGSRGDYVKIKLEGEGNDFTVQE
jgi:hypothetical protein